VKGMNILIGKMKGKVGLGNMGIDGVITLKGTIEK
jgi:hypothetical protein